MSTFIILISKGEGQMVIICDKDILEKKKNEKGANNYKELAESFSGVTFGFSELTGDGVKIFLEGDVDAMKEFMLFVKGGQFRQEELIWF